MSDEPSSGALPDSWNTKTLGEVCLSVAKIDPSDLGRDQFKYVDIGSINSDRNSIESPQVLPSSEAPARARQHLRFGDSVFATVRPYLRKIAWVDESLDGEIASTGFCVLRPDPSLLLPRFLRFFAVSDNLLAQVLPLQRGVSYPAVRDKEVLSATFALPPLDEQAKIVEILEEQFSRLNAALEAVRTVRVKADQFRRSLLHAAITGALTGHKTAQGHVPDGWLGKQLDEVLEVLIDHRGKTATKLGGTFVDSGVRVISAIHVKNGNLRFEERDRFVTDAIFQKWMPVTTRMGDVILTSEAPLGMVAVVPTEEPLVLSQRLFCLRGNSAILSNAYLRRFLESPHAQEQLTRRSSGTTVSGIRQSELRQLVVPLPPLPEQEEIVEILQEQLSRLDASLAAADAVEKQAVTLRRSLLHAAFTGNLTTEWRESAHD